MTCSTEGCSNMREGRTEFCASCNRNNRKSDKKVFELPTLKKPIAKVSGKMAIYLARYKVQKAKWIRGKKCAVFHDQIATTVHHMKGRVGFADQWAKDNDIPLLLDERFWIPASMDGHIKIENNPEWAKKNKFSLNRLGVLHF